MDAVPGHAARRSAWPCVLHNCREFTPDRIRKIRWRQRQKHHDGLDPSSYRSVIYHSTNCATLPLCLITWIRLFNHRSEKNIMSHPPFIIAKIPSLYCTVNYTILHTILQYTILYYTVLYYTILYYSILYYTILYYTILYYTILYNTILYYTILYYTILYYTIL